MNNIREKSGLVSDNRILVAFIYMLMRDHLPTHVVEEITQELENQLNPTVFEFSNGWLAQYAKFLADRLENKNKVKIDAGVSIEDMHSVVNNIIPAPLPQRIIREGELPKKKDYQV